MLDGPANPTRRWAAAAIAATVAVWLCYAGVRHEIASHFLSSENPENWERAVRFESDNPDTWYRLGRYRQLDFEHADLPLSISFYQRAIQLNSPSPYYKLDLASALEMSGNDGEADRYFREAKEGYPISAEVYWKYGNFLLRQHQLPQAYAEIHHAVMVDDKLIPLAVSRVWRSNPDVTLLLDQILPDTAEARSDAMAFFSDEKDPDGALAVWKRQIAKNATVDWKMVYRLTDMLVGGERFEDAGGVWRQAVARDQAAAGGYSGDSLMFDGGFEHETSGGGFGWQQRDVSGAQFDFDSDIKHAGNRSARITFDGSQNLVYQDLFQYVLVSPGVRYHFQGYLRTERISTDSGVRFELIDPIGPGNLNIVTANETGTQPWTLEEANFTANPKTHLVRIRLIRNASERFDNKISGTAWVDDVSLTSVSGSK